MFGARLLGPSALQRYDQPRTASYTADIVANGNWLLPRDMLGRPATKPPLVNWLAAPLLMLGFWTEWAVKAPMLAASIATLFLTMTMARRLLPQTPDAGCLAGIAWLVSPVNVNMIYHCRPDPVLVAFLTGAWLLGSRIVAEESEPPLSVTVGFWVCVGLAGLTKGPAALLPVLYLPLAARIIAGRWSAVHRSQWWWGLPLAFGIFLAWAIPCAIRYPDEFFRVLIGREFIAQTFGLGDQFGSKRETITSEGPITALRLAWQNPLWFISHFLPWSLAALGALIVVGWRRWFRHPLAPAVLWLFLVLGFFSLSAHKTADYIQPAFPAAAVLAIWFLQRWMRGTYIAIVGVVLAVGLAVDWVFFSSAARTREGENVKEFARAVSEIVRTDAIAFEDTGFNTVQLFLRRNQASPRPTPEQLATAKWIIRPVSGDAPATVVSKPLPTKPASKRIVLGLYKVNG